MLGISVGVLKDNVDVTNFGVVVDLELPHPADDNGLRVDQLLSLAELFNVLANPILVDEDLFPMRLGALVGQMDFQTTVEKGEFPQPVRQDIELELGRDGKNFGVRQKCDEGAGMLLFWTSPMTSSLRLVLPLENRSGRLCHPW